MSRQGMASLAWACFAADAVMGGASPSAAQSGPDRAMRSPDRTVTFAVESTANVRTQFRIDGVGGQSDGPAVWSGGLGISLDRRFGLVTLGGGIAAHVVDYRRGTIAPVRPLDVYDVPARLGVRDSIRTRFGAIELGVVGIMGPSISTRRWADSLTRAAPRLPGPEKRANFGAVVGGLGALSLRHESFVWSLEAGYVHRLVAGFDIVAPSGIEPSSFGEVLDVRLALGGPCLRMGFGFAR